MPYTFRLVRGSHEEGGIINPKTGKRTQSRVYSRGDQFQSEHPLDEMFNAPGSFKFERLGESAAAPQPKVAVAVADESAEDNDADLSLDDFEEAVSDGLDDMSVGELRAFAKDRDIDLGAARRKSDIIDVIREELPSAEE